MGAYMWVHEDSVSNSPYVCLGLVLMWIEGRIRVLEWRDIDVSLRRE
jgi:hypothetical protein